MRLGLPMGDLAAGMFAGFGILAALHARAETGFGRHVEVSMLDSMVSLLSYLGAHYLQTGEVPGPQGSGHQVNVPYQAFETATDWIVVAIFGDRFWKEFCEVLGLDDLIDDARYATAGERSRRRQEILDRIEPILKSRPADDWIPEMLAKKIPCGPINRVDRAIDDPVIRSRHMVVTTVHEAYGQARAPGNPMKVEGIEDGVARPAPLPGEDNARVLREFVGATDRDLDEFKRKGVI